MTPNTDGETQYDWIFLVRLRVTPVRLDENNCSRNIAEEDDGNARLFPGFENIFLVYPTS